MSSNICDVCGSPFLRDENDEWIMHEHPVRQKGSCENENCIRPNCSCQRCNEGDVTCGCKCKSATTPKEDKEK